MNKPPLKEAIGIVFLEIGEKTLNFGDITYLLLDKEYKRYPTKERKDKYMEWEKKFSHKSFPGEERLNKNTLKIWNPPFKQYDYSPQFIDQTLTEMQDEGTIKKTKNGKYKPTKIFLKDAIRLQNKYTLDLFNRNEILDFHEISNPPPYSKRILYGISLKTYKALDESDQQTIKNCIDTIEENLNKISNVISEKSIKKITEQFMKTTRSEKIKYLLEHDSWVFWGEIFNRIAMFQYMNYESIGFDIDKTDSSSDIELLWFVITMELAYSQVAKDNHLSKSEIIEIVRWTYKNRDVFYRLPGIVNIAFSRYVAMEEDLNKVHMKQAKKKSIEENILSIHEDVLEKIQASNDDPNSVDIGVFVAQIFKLISK